MTLNSHEGYRPNVSNTRMGDGEKWMSMSSLSEIICPTFAIQFAALFIL